MQKISLKILDFYQKFLSVLGFGSCRYYPTCSEYAKWRFENENFFVAFYHSSLRILRCNQLFSGGIDYPIVKRNLKRNRLCLDKQDKNHFNVKFYLIPKGKQDYYLIKRLKGNAN